MKYNIDKSALSIYKYKLIENAYKSLTDDKQRNQNEKKNFLSSIYS